MAMNPFAPSQDALNGYLKAVRQTLEIVPQVYTPCSVDNIGHIGLFLIANNLTIHADQYGITISK